MDALFLVLISYCLLQRLVELPYSFRNQQKMLDAGFKRQEPGLSLAIMILLHATWYIAVLLEWYRPFVVLPDLVRGVAAVLFIGAQFLRYWMLWALGPNWNISVMTPGESAGQSFVSVGPYKYIRHPNYLALMIEIAALPILGNAVFSCITLSLCNAILIANRVAIEESFLFRRSGYREIMGGKPRFLPGF